MVGPSFTETVNRTEPPEATKQRILDFCKVSAGEQFSNSMFAKQYVLICFYFKASTAAELSDGLAMSEVLVQIEPATFTPTWFAGILKSQQSNSETLGVLLNMLLHYYRHNLSEECVTGDNLPIPNIPTGNGSHVDTCLPVEDVSQFLKLILGVAVTCNNKLLFINKIQSLDETTQHALTACIVSFISTKVTYLASCLHSN